MSDYNPPDHRTHLGWVRSHQREVFGAERTAQQVIAFVAGFDAATGYSMLRGFQEWLVVRLGDGHEVHWMGLVARSVAQANDPADGVLALVDDFLSDVDDRDGRRVLYRRFDELRSEYLSDG